MTVGLRKNRSRPFVEKNCAGFIRCLVVYGWNYWVTSALGVRFLYGGLGFRKTAKIPELDVLDWNSKSGKEECVKSS